MRRIRLLVPLVLLMASIPAWAGEKSPIEVMPNPVRHGETLKVKAHDCYSGKTWTAYVIVKILDGDEETASRQKVLADDSGTTVVKFPIKKKKYPKGRYSVQVDCRHEFDGGGADYWYRSGELLEVKRKAS